MILSNDKINIELIYISKMSVIERRLPVLPTWSNFSMWRETIMILKNTLLNLRIFHLENLCWLILYSFAMLFFNEIRTSE